MGMIKKRPSAIWVLCLDVPCVDMLRSMDTIITVIISPIALMLLFAYVLGGAIETGTEN